MSARNAALGVGTADQRCWPFCRAAAIVAVSADCRLGSFVPSGKSVAAHLPAVAKVRHNDVARKWPAHPSIATALKVLPASAALPIAQRDE